MTEVELVEVTWMRVFKVWWSLLWRGLLFFFLAAGGAGFILSFLMQLIKAEPMCCQHLNILKIQLKITQICITKL